MKLFFSFLLTSITLGAQAQDHKLVRLWESDTTLAIPESVLPDTQKGILYVSLINGGPWDKDGKGEIAQLDMTGKIKNASWATGLHAPKGMAIVGDKLYVADVTEVVIINTASGKTESRISVDSSEMLNDVTADNKGVVYVSDSKTGKVHKIENGKATLFLSSLNGVNGLKYTNDALYILTKQMLKADSNGKLTKVTDLEQGGDGLEPVGDGSFIASSWGGTVYYIGKDGKTHLMLDTREQKKNTADIGYDPVKKIVYVPTFFAKSVVAYQFQ
jgi:sugar lactone lactonase YvrE